MNEDLTGFFLGSVRTGLPKTVVGNVDYKKVRPAEERRPPRKMRRGRRLGRERKGRVRRRGRLPSPSIIWLPVHT